MVAYVFCYCIAQVSFVKVDIDNQAVGSTVSDHSITGVVRGAAWGLGHNHYGRGCV